MPLVGVAAESSTTERIDPSAEVSLWSSVISRQAGVTVDYFFIMHVRLLQTALAICSGKVAGRRPEGSFHHLSFHTSTHLRVCLYYVLFGK
jgi:hypothetical protein